MKKTRLMLGFFCLLLLAYIAVYTVKWAPRITHGYAAYYTFSRMLLDGDDLSKAYDAGYFNLKVKEYGMDVSEILDGNVPTNSFALMPFAWLNPSSARVTWSLFSLAAFFCSVYILFRVYGLSLKNELGLGLLIVAFLWRPLYENIALGQLFAVLLFLFSISLLGLIKKKPAVLSSSLSVVFLIKGYGVVNFLWLAIKKKRKELLLTLGIILMVVLISVTILGLSTWEAFISAAPRELGLKPELGHVAYQTVSSFIMHLFIYDTKWLPHPVIGLPSAAVFFVCITINLLIMIFIIGKNVSQEQVLLSFSAAVAAGVVTAPVAEEYHYLLFLPLVIGLGKYLYERHKEMRSVGFIEILFIIAVLVMIVPINYKVYQFSNSPVYLLAYPKLYAGIILLVVYRFSINNSAEARHGIV